MANRIFITGDCHGDFRRFNTENFPEQRTMDREDYVIICGDAGFLWADDKADRYWIDWMAAKPFTTLYVDGNHENFDRLYALPEEHWHGGKVHFIAPNIIHLMRGQLFDVANRRIFAFGGAQSHDIRDGILEMDDPHFHEKRRRLRQRGGMYRINRLNWWKEEIPSEAECAEALRNLEVCGWQADIILSHAAPTAVAKLLSPEYGSTPPEVFLETLRQKCRYGKWFFGHYHEDRRLSLRETALYGDIIPLL